MSNFPTDEWSHLVAALQPFQEARYTCFWGNAGDALIASGALRLFELAGIRPQACTAAAVQAGDRVIIAGGGNLVPQYRDCAGILRRCLEMDAERVLLLPHTIRGHEELLGLLDDRFTFACRDHDSLQWVRKHAPRSNAFFCHDLALLLDPGSYASKPLDITGRWKRHCMSPKYMRWQMRLLGVDIRQGVLSIFRGDDERTAGLAEQQDVSGFYGSDYIAPGECDDITGDVFRLIKRADVLHTNRLHMGIAGALNGLRVHLYDNSYGKISAIHQSSLSRLSNVSFEGEVAGPTMSPSTDSHS